MVVELLVSSHFLAIVGPLRRFDHSWYEWRGRKTRNIVKRVTSIYTTFRPAAPAFELRNGTSLYRVLVPEILILCLRLCHVTFVIYLCISRGKSTSSITALDAAPSLFSHRRRILVDGVLEFMCKHYHAIVSVIYTVQYVSPLTLCLGAIDKRALNLRALPLGLIVRHSASTSARIGNQVQLNLTPFGFVSCGMVPFSRQGLSSWATQYPRFNIARPWPPAKNEIPLQCDEKISYQVITDLDRQ